jgi:hypothetical protein
VGRTVQDGGRLWALFESCMRVFKSGAATCTDKTEACCKRGVDDPESDWVNVWSLTNKAAGDSLLTVQENERSSLLKGGWTEVCSPAGGASAFCGWGGNSNAIAPSAPDYTSSPFVMYASAISATLSAPCHRCITAATPAKHFISSTSDCLGKGKLESTLGYVSTERSSDTPRSLRLCQGVAGEMRHSLDSECADGMTQLEFLGFVH